MASIHSFSLPDNFDAGASFMLSKQPWGDRTQDLSGARVVIRGGQPRIHVALSQISASASAEDLVKRSLPFAQDFLDFLAVQEQLAYRIVNQNDNAVWRRTASLPELQISATLPVRTGMSASPQMIDAEGNIVQSHAQSPKAQAAFRYYRFASSSGDLFEAYRYIYLCLESALDDLDPRAKLVQKRRGKKKRSEREWLVDALGHAKSKYLLDLNAFSANPLDAVNQFIGQHYEVIRCATFHGKAGALMPGIPRDVKRVDEQLGKLQPIVKQLLKEHFGVNFPSSGMTPYFLNFQLETLIPGMRLATSPMKVTDLGQEVRLALIASGYYETLPKRLEDVTDSTFEKLNQTIHTAQERFSFDLVRVTLDGKRPGYNDEWIVTGETKTDEVRHSEIRSMALFFMLDETTIADVFLRAATQVFASKTVSTDLDLTGIGSIVYKLRIVLRSFQEFPKEFASY
jgi:hypothetical protein